MKTMSSMSKVLALLASSALLAACGTTRLPDDRNSSAAVGAATPVPAAASTDSTAAQSAGTPQSGVATVNLEGGAAAGGATGLPSQRVVFFDFDSYAIKDDFKPLLDGFSRALAANRGKKLMIEGHTDERGGREYNLALGQKRAAAVVSSLTLLGVNDGQVEAVSFGEERPSAQGAGEAAWAQNRRAELKDR